MKKIITNKLSQYLLICFFTIGIFAGFTKTAIAQNADSKGKDFWLMFNSNYSNTPELTLFITSAVNTSGVVTVPGLAFSAPYTVAANTVTPVIIPSTVATHINNVIDYKGIHVTAIDEVTVYGLNRIPYTTDAYLGLPTDVLGTDYMILTYRAGEIGVVATQNSTVVTITPTITTLTRTAGVPFNITLNQGQTYELENTNTTLDFSGTTITSNKPIGVMGAVRCANIPPGVSYCDHICEMLPPTTTFGRKFATVPLASRSNGDTWRMLASENNTIVKINGVAEAPINRGQYIEKILLTQSLIESDKPILVAQYANGSSLSGNPGDPFMMLIPSLEQFLAGYTLTTVSGFVAHYINIVAPKAVVGLLTLDGVAIPAAKYTAIGTSGFSGAQIKVTDGSHTLAAKLAFGAFQYGFNNDDSYGYPGGQSFSKVATVNSVILAPKGATAQINTNACFTATVKDQFNAPVTDVRVDFVITGPNSTSTGFANTNASGVANFCYTGTVIGTDNITASVSSLSDATTFVWTTVNNCAIKLTKTAINPACNGANNGSIDLTVSGGTLPATYLWSNGAATQDITGLSAGTYTVKVTDKNACTQNLSVVLTNPAILNNNITISPNPTVSGQAMATIWLGYGPQSVTLTANASGGTGAISYNWGALGTSSSIQVSPIVTTTYCCTVKDTKGCIKTSKVTIYVIDIKCGFKGDKFITCLMLRGTNTYQTYCICIHDLERYLGKGGKLGKCQINVQNRSANPFSMDGLAYINDAIIDIPEGDGDLITQQLKTYPNPAKNYVDVRWGSTFANTNIELNVYDISGKLAMTFKPGKTNMKRLDVSKLGNGLYLLKVISNGITVQSTKVVIQK